MSSKIQHARRLLLGAGVVREDSDDELGLDDHPWEWIYSKNHETGQGEIVGARMGSFQCKLGDCVLLKAEGAKEAWVGLICEFVEENDEGQKAANFMWFSSEREIRNRAKKRKDFLPVSLELLGSLLSC